MRHLIGRSDGRAVRVGAIALVVIAACAALAYGLASASGGESQASSGASILDLPSNAGPVVPADYADSVSAADRMDLTAVRKLRSPAGVDAYVGPVKGDSSQFCLFAARRASEGVYGAWTCGPDGGVAAGTVGVELQTQAGGIEAPRVRVGLVPDGVVRVEAVGTGEVDGLVSVVKDNTYSFNLPDGESFKSVRLISADGNVKETPPLVAP